MRSSLTAFAMVGAATMLAGTAAAQAPGQMPPAAPGQTIVVVQQPGMAQPPPGYGPTPSGYGQPPPGYQPLPPGYPQAPSGTYYAPPPGYGYGYGPTPLGPKVIDYEEGDTIPPGYRTGTRVRKGLVIGGSVMLGVGYLLSIITAGFGQLANDIGSAGTKDFGPLLIPVAGPWIGMGTTHPSTGGVFGLAFLGVTQAAGLGMLIGGIAAPKTVLVRNEVLGMRVTVAPQLGASSAGMGVIGSF